MYQTFERTIGPSRITQGGEPFCELTDEPSSWFCTNDRMQLETIRDHTKTHENPLADRRGGCGLVQDYALGNRPRKKELTKGKQLLVNTRRDPLWPPYPGYIMHKTSRYGQVQLLKSECKKTDVVSANKLNQYDG